MHLIQQDGINYLVHTEKEAVAVGLSWAMAEPLIEGTSQIPRYLALDAKTADDLTKSEADDLMEELSKLLGHDHPSVVETAAFLAFLITG